MKIESSIVRDNFQPIAAGLSGRSRILKGGVPLSRTFSTALVRVHEACNTCVQNDKKGVLLNPRNPLDPPLGLIMLL